MNSPTRHDLYSVSMVTPADGWAVGDQTILHWDGQSWSQVANPFPEDLTSVSAATPPDVWAVGAQDILYGNGRTWVRVPTPTESIRSLALISDDGWVVGYGGLILRYSPYLPVRRWYLPSISAQRPAAANVRSSLTSGR